MLTGSLPITGCLISLTYKFSMRQKNAFRARENEANVRLGNLEKFCVKVRSFCLYSALIPGKEFRQTRKESIQTTQWELRNEMWKAAGADPEEEFSEDTVIDELRSGTFW